VRPQGGDQTFLRGSPLVVVTFHGVYNFDWVILLVWLS
jgi:hypothetical protein